MNPESKSHLGHLENKHLVGIRVLTQEFVLLNIGPVAIASERGNAIHDPKSSNILERGDVIFDAWGAHVFALPENRD